MSSTVKSHLPHNPNISLGVGPDGIDYCPRDIYIIEMTEKGYAYSESFTIRTDQIVTFNFIQKVEGLDIVLFMSASEEKQIQALIRADNNTIIYLSSWDHKTFSFYVSGIDIKSVKDTICLIEKLIPKNTITRNAEYVPISFWSLGPRGPVHRDKKIQPLLWDQIDTNYSEKTREKIEELRAVQPPLDGGRLVLWHGIPGTGKSSAIRNLVYEWLPWCDTSVVVDPENFFGSADYMLSVLLDTPSYQYGYTGDYDEDDDDDHITSKFTLQGKDRWNLLVIEDADEFINANAKERTGQGLSRLLNLADGLIGQGMNFMILITTNEKLSNIHEAVGREGRCFAKTEFAPFTRKEAELWLGDYADSIKGNSSNNQFTLAQLFDKKRERQQIKTDTKEVNIGVYL